MENKLVTNNPSDNPEDTTVQRDGSAQESSNSHQTTSVQIDNNIQAIRDALAESANLVADEEDEDEYDDNEYEGEGEDYDPWNETDASDAAVDPEEECGLLAALKNTTSLIDAKTHDSDLWTCQQRPKEDIAQPPLEETALQDILALNPDIVNEIRGMRFKGYPVEHCQIILAHEQPSNGIEDLILRRLVDGIYAQPIDLVGSSDGDLARYTLQAMNESVVYATDLKRFMLWNGTIWLPDDAYAQTEKAIYEKLITAPAQTNDTNLQRKLWDRVNCASTVNSVRSFMQRIVEHVTLDKFDANDRVLNCRNGLVELTSDFRFRKTLPQDYVTMLANVEYDATARCPKFEAFLEENMLGDADYVSLLQALMGYALLGGGNRERLMFVLLGGGRNGKSTFVRILMRLLGSYATSMAFKTLLQTNDTGPRDDLMSLASRRLITCAEFDKKDTISARVAKSITGNDMMKARALYSAYTDLSIGGTILLSLNSLPQLSDDSGEAMWDRLRIIPFNYRVTEEQENPELFNELIPELAGILNFALHGLERYFRDRKVLTQETPAMLEAKERYRSRQNPVRAFLTTHYARTSSISEKTKSIDIIEAFHQWAHEHGVPIQLSAQLLKKEITALGIPANGTQGRFYMCKQIESEEDSLE